MGDTAIPIAFVFIVGLLFLGVLLFISLVLRVGIEAKTDQFETETGGKRNLAADLFQSSCENGFSTTASLDSPKESMKIYSVAEYDVKIYIDRIFRICL